MGEVRVWVGLLLAMSISSLLLVLRNLLEAKLAPRIQPTESYLVTMVQIFRILMGQGIRIPRTWRRRLLPGVWILFGQTLSLGYSGTLISYMAHPGLEEAVDTVAKLAQAIRKGTFTCGTIRDAAEHSMLRVR
ncbi:uncharacterized protein LOC121046570 [Ixodes scapularis]|uniref:uncharacterized protein LOC121046570 n=1 Tax=Ixodes scapularis TaxID=6945 RepID=UPI001C385D88|nr:uncharacterized protein LOC121046570 [Ixodes scapularis]